MLRFTKMHGIGNDYVFVDCTKESPADLPGLARRISDRHFGVGSDGLICICPSDRADFRMRMFNADGSEGAMCGNGIRCVGKFVYDRRMTERTVLTVETAAGVKELRLRVEGGKAVGATVDMGEPTLGKPLVVPIAGKEITFTPVSMGNPHAVSLCPRPEDIDLALLGPAAEHSPCFPGRVNVEFAAVESPRRIRLRVWERGSGETLACGTGACAALAALASQGLCEREVTAVLPGGALEVRWADDGHIYMSGPAVTVFEGEYEHGTDEREFPEAARQLPLL